MINGVNSNYNYTNLNSQVKQEKTQSIDDSADINNPNYRGKKAEIKGRAYSGYAQNGDVTILGKAFGYDKNMSNKEVEDLRKFLYEDNKVLGLGVFFEDEFSPLLNSTLNIEEFKEKYLEAKKDFEDKFNKAKQEFEDKFNTSISNQTPQTTNNQNTSINSTSTTKDNQTQQKQETNKTFKPIQGESKNKETYKDTYMNETLKKLLENKFDEKQLLEMLFGIKSNNDDTNNVNFRKLISQMGLNKSIDIKV